MSYIVCVFSLSGVLTGEALTYTHSRGTHRWAANIFSQQDQSVNNLLIIHE